MLLKTLAIISLIAFTIPSVGQRKVYNMAEAANIVPGKNYRAAVDINNTFAVFANRLDTFDMCFNNMIDALSDTLRFYGFKDDKDSYICGKIYFNKAGSVDYLTYRAQNLKSKQEELFKTTCEKFVTQYRLPLTATQDYSHVFSIPVAAQISGSSDIERGPIDQVHDFEGILTETQAAQLGAWLQELELTRKISTAVATFDSRQFAYSDFRTEVAKIGNQLMLGGPGKKGVMIGISARDKNICVLTGKGIKAVLPDDEMKQMIDAELRPLFDQGKYYEALDQFIHKLMKRL